MHLLAEMPCSTAAAAAETKRGAAEVQVQPSSSQNPRPANVPRYLYQAANAHKCTCTGTHTVHTNTHRDNKPQQRPSAGLFSSNCGFSLPLRKKGHFGESHQHFHIHIVCSHTVHQHAHCTMQHCTQTSHHVT